MWRVLCNTLQRITIVIHSNTATFKRILQRNHVIHIFNKEKKLPIYNGSFFSVNK